MDGQDATKARLLQAAGEEFAEKGFECGAIRASATGRRRMSRRSITISATRSSSTSRRSSTRIAAASRPASEGEDESGEPAEQLRRFIHHFLCRVLALHDPDDWRHRLVLREMLNPTSASDVLIRDAIRPRFERLIGILRRFCPDADERKMHALAFSVIGQCLHYKMARPIAVRLVGAEASRRWTSIS